MSDVWRDDSTPRIRRPSNRKNFGRSSGVIVDICRRHGVWFDRGELPRVLAFVEGKPKKESSTATTVALGSLVVLRLFMAGGVLVYAITSPGAGGCGDA